MNMQALVDLQLHGVAADLTPARTGGAGPSYSKAFLLNGRPVMLPVAKEDAWDLIQLNGGYLLSKKDCSFPTSIVPQAKFYALKTNDGIPYRKIALLHGKNCLASTVLQHCVRYSNPKLRCQFCSLGETLNQKATIAKKTPAQLAEVAVAAKKLDLVTHVTLTSGTTRPIDSGILYLGECAKAVTDATDLPVQIQFEPPEDFGLFEKLHSMGVANVGMHVESLDEEVRKRVIPGKAEIPLERYFAAFEEAVRVFGKNRVSTYVILGLGEDYQKTLSLTKKLVQIGVYPNLVPMHHHPGTTLCHLPNPKEEDLLHIYEEVGCELKKEGLTRLGNVAGCGRCGACSLLQFTEEEVLPLDKEEQKADLAKKEGNSLPNKEEISVVTSKEELEICHMIRQKVFCEEQKIFERDDADHFDRKAIHILARINGEPAGTVRCFERRPGIWVGGRLAVLPEFRGRLGAKLVRKAVAVMEERGDVVRFFAIVQVQNVRFFKILGWQCLGQTFVCNTRTHQVMEKPLKRTK
ncbi:MAG: MSMEG_0568 family radical SAM protein [Desulfovibrionaceae bacterium]|nr:MSMEG_0568 family radical SAM protein [Desulfovibrionaceae bacterium]